MPCLRFDRMCKLSNAPFISAHLLEWGSKRFPVLPHPASLYSRACRLQITMTCVADVDAMAESHRADINAYLQKNRRQPLGTAA